MASVAMSATTTTRHGLYALRTAPTLHTRILVLGARRLRSTRSVEDDAEETARRIVASDAPRRIAVIGGGISGLSTAYYLKRMDPSVNVTIFERSTRPGGFIASTIATVPLEPSSSATSSSSSSSTESKATVIQEWGPRSLRTVGRGSQALLQLIHDIGLSNKISFADSSNARKRFLLENGAIQRLFGSVNDLFLSVIIPLLIEPFRPIRRLTLEDESVHEFVQRRLGRRLATVVGAAARGIYGGDTKRLSARSSFTAPLWKAEIAYRSSLMQFLFGKEVVRKAANANMLPSPECERFISSATMRGVYTLKDGLQSLPDALHKTLVSQGVEFVPNSMVKDVFLGEHHDVMRSVLDKADGLSDAQGSSESTFRSEDVVVRISEKDGTVTSRVFDHVICAVPSYEAAQLLALYDVHDVLTSIPHVNMISVNVVLPTDVKYQGFGYLVPPTETREAIYGTIFDSKVFPELATPNGKVGMLSVMIPGGVFASGPHSRYVGSQISVYEAGSTPTKDSEDAQVVATVRDAVERHLGMKWNPLRVQIVRHGGCIPQHEVAHAHKMDALRRLVINGPLCNRVSLLHTSYQGVGVRNSIQNARELAEYLMTLGRNTHVRDVTGLEFTRSVYRESTV